MKRSFFTAIFILCAECIFSQIYLHSAQEALDCARTYSRENTLKEQYAKEALKLAKKNITGFLPSLEFSWSENDRINTGERDTRLKTAGFGITQKVFNGGKTALEYKMQVSTGRLNFYSMQKEIQSFEAEVIRLYYQNLLAAEKVRAQKESLKLSEEILKLAELQLQEGLVTENDYLEAKLSAMQASLQLKEYENAVSAQNRELRVLLALPAKTQLFFCSSEETVSEALPSFLEDKTALSKAAVQNSIELKKIDAETDWAKKQLALQKMIFMPAISFTGSIEFSGRHYPLTEPSFTLKVSVAFDSNPWLPAKCSLAGGTDAKTFNSAGKEIYAQGIPNTTFVSQMRMAKINLMQKTESRRRMVLQTENSVESLSEEIIQSAENLALNIEILSVCRNKTKLQKLQWEEGFATMADFLESLDRETKQKIKVLENRNTLDYMITQMEILTGIKKQEETE